MDEIPLKKDVEEQLLTFVVSDQFNNFKDIMENYAAGHFKTMQAKDKKPYEEMLANKEILAFYMNFPVYLKSKVDSIEKRRVSELAEKVRKAQEEL